MLMDVQKAGMTANSWEFDAQAGGEILQAATDLQPLLREYAAFGDQHGYPAPEVIEAIDKADLFAVAVPKRVGGRGVSATALVRMGAALSKGDPSAAWVTQIINGTTWVTSLGPDALQDELFGNGIIKAAGAFNPPGTAIPVAGGYRVTGAWPYASAIRHADWGQWGIKIVHPDGQAVFGNFCYIPAAELKIEKTWNVTGMQGTGSDTVVVNDLFVPENRVVHAARSFNYVPEGKRNYGAPSDYFAQMAMVHRTMTGVPLGAAEGLLEFVSEGAKTKAYVGTVFARQADSQVIAKDIGEAAAKIGAARLLIENATMTLDQAALDRRVLSERERAANKAEANFALQILGQAVDTLMYVAGSGGFNNSSPAARYWRDFNMIARHFGNIPNVGYEVLGRSILGIIPSAVPPHMY